MKKFFLTWLMLGIFTGMGAQEVWVKVTKGNALYLNPAEMEWVLLSEKQQIPEKCYLMTKEEAQVTLSRETAVYQLPAGAYLYVADVFPKDRVEVVGALTQIEAEQLPANFSEPQEEPSRPVGLTYGKPAPEKGAQVVVPHETERLVAINWFWDQGRLDGALLTLKRTMSQFPDLYRDSRYVERLLTLYDSLALYGFLLDETGRLQTIQASEEFRQMVQQWQEVARGKLVGD